MNRPDASRSRTAAATGAHVFAATLRVALSGHGLALDHVRTFPGSPTGNALIRIYDSVQNVITVTGGANMAWPDREPRLTDPAGGHVALFQAETPLAATLSANRAARAPGAIVVLGSAPIPSAGIDGLPSCADAATPNNTEVKALLGTLPKGAVAALAAARALQARGSRLAIVELGAPTRPPPA